MQKLINQANPIACPFCNKKYPQLEVRNRHIIDTHPDRIEVRWGEKDWVCWEPKQQILCDRCEREISIREADTYGGRCEECWYEDQQNNYSELVATQ